MNPRIYKLLNLLFLQLEVERLASGTVYRYNIFLLKEKAEGRAD
jgi:hypothetical protein